MLNQPIGKMDTDFGIKKNIKKKVSKLFWLIHCLYIGTWFWSIEILIIYPPMITRHIIFIQVYIVSDVSDSKIKFDFHTHTHMALFCKFIIVNKWANFLNFVDYICCNDLDDDDERCLRCSHLFKWVIVFSCFLFFGNCFCH